MKIKQGIILLALLGLAVAPSTAWAITMRVSPNLRIIATTSAINVQVNSSSTVPSSTEAGTAVPKLEVPKSGEIKPITATDSKVVPTPGEINSINPQPEPPVSRDNVSNGLNLVSLNPQPEPPLPGVKITELLRSVGNPTSGQGQQVMSGKIENQIKGFSIKAEKTGNGNLLKFEKSENEDATSTTLGLDASRMKFILAGSKISIASDTLDFSAVGDKTPVVEFKTTNSPSSAPTLVKIKMLNNNAVLNFAKGNGEGTITIKSDFAINDGKIVLSGQSGDISLAQNPDSFYLGLEKGLKNKDKGIKIQSADLQIKNGKPVYDVKIKERVKLFGIIPLAINSDLIANGIDNSVTGVNRPWFASLSSHADIPSIKLVPDFAVTNVELVPNTYHKGDKVTAKVTISNVGTTIGVSEYNIGTGACTTIVYYWGQSQIQWYCSLLALNVGESATYDFNLSNAPCEQFKFVFDPGKSMEDDPDYGNNTGYAQGNCSE